MPDLINDEVFDDFNNRIDAFIRDIDAFIRDKDWSSAEALCRSHLENAERTQDPEAAALFSEWVANTLAWQGRQEEALAYKERAERHVPLDGYRKVLVARYLTTELQRPEDGLAKLAEAEPLLKDHERRAWLNESGLALLALGRDSEAVEYFRELTSPERLATMREFNYLGLVDFRLVSELVNKGLAAEMCTAYLAVAEVVGAQKDNPVDRRILQDLIGRLYDAGA
jgi:hypothetical protein